MSRYRGMTGSYIGVNIVHDIVFGFGKVPNAPPPPPPLGEGAFHPQSKLEEVTPIGKNKEALSSRPTVTPPRPPSVPRFISQLVKGWNGGRCQRPSISPFFLFWPLPRGLRLGRQRPSPGSHPHRASTTSAVTLTRVGPRQPGPAGPGQARPGRPGLQGRALACRHTERRQPSNTRHPPPGL